MPRRFVLTAAAVAVVSGLAFTSACSSYSGEQQMLRKYFQANQLRDQSTVGNVATVEFNPTTDGTVQSFNVTSVSEERRKTLNIRQYAEEFKKAKEDNDAFTKEVNKYQKDNAVEIDRVTRAAGQNKPLRGKDAELHASWQKWVADRVDHTHRLTESRRKLAAETRVAELSTFNALKPIDVTGYDGELISKDVTVAAKVKRPDGSIVDRTLVVIMEKATLKGPEGERDGRWIITEIKGR
ncbi:MAG TPA: hypothetical protein VK886_13940 [Vicinamibacterales bacterium]|nr:hypothetical protein [Vicinamibacterales bacterium]